MIPQRRFHIGNVIQFLGMAPNADVFGPVKHDRSFHRSGYYEHNDGFILNASYFKAEIGIIRELRSQPDAQVLIALLAVSGLNVVPTI